MPPQRCRQNHSYYHIRIQANIVRRDLLNHLDEKFVEYACQLERGEQTGRRHYQMVVKTDPKKTRARMVEEWCMEFHYLREHLRIDAATGEARADGAEWYCEPQRTRGRARYTYVLKTGTRIAGPWTKNVSLPPQPVRLLDPDAMHMWQTALLQTLDENPDDRTIHWYWEPCGGSGKSVLCKYLCAKMDAIICSGRASDMKYLIAQYIKRRKTHPRIILFDVPRTNAKFIDYQGLEEIKNGLFASTKYECAMITMNSPHVVVFANNPPDQSKLSADRWNIIRIQNNDDHETELQE